MSLLSKIYAGAAIVALICSPTVLSETTEKPVAERKSVTVPHRVPHAEAVAVASRTKLTPKVFSRLKPASPAEKKSGVNRLLSKTLTPDTLPAKKSSTLDAQDSGVFTFTRSVATKGRNLFNSLVRSVEDAADGSATKLFRTLQLPTLPSSPLPSIAKSLESDIDKVPQTSALVPHTSSSDGPRLSDAWLNEVSNEPNMDFERLLGWDVYIYANRTIIPSAQACLAGAQEALYQLSEKQVLLFSNCVKSTAANQTSHHECQCFASHDRQGTAISSNVWQLGGCCTEEVLEFNEAAAEINVNRSAVLNLADACLARCGAAVRGLGTPSQIIPLMALVTAFLFML